MCHEEKWEREKTGNHHVVLMVAPCLRFPISPFFPFSPITHQPHTAEQSVLGLEASDLELLKLIHIGNSGRPRPVILTVPRGTVPFSLREDRDSPRQHAANFIPAGLGRSHRRPPVRASPTNYVDRPLRVREIGDTQVWPSGRGHLRPVRAASPPRRSRRSSRPACPRRRPPAAR